MHSEINELRNEASVASEFVMVAPSLKLLNTLFNVCVKAVPSVAFNFTVRLDPLCLALAMYQLGIVAETLLLFPSPAYEQTPSTLPFRLSGM